MHKFAWTLLINFTDNLCIKECQAPVYHKKQQQQQNPLRLTLTLS